MLIKLAEKENWFWLHVKHKLRVPEKRLSILGLCNPAIESAFIAHGVLYSFQLFPHWLSFSKRRSKNWNVEKNVQNAVQDPIDIVVKLIDRRNVLSWTVCSNINDQIVNIQWSTDENEPNDANGTKPIYPTLRFCLRSNQVKNRM